MTSRVSHGFADRAARHAVGLMLVLAVGGCRETPLPSPVATPVVRLDRTRVPQGGPLGMTYRFTVAADAPAFSEAYRVFVHCFTATGELVFTDDHDPPVPTTDWQPGQEIVYDRWMVVPVSSANVGEVTIGVGLYSTTGGDRLPLAGEGLGQRAYRVAAFDVAPPSGNVLTFADGWHPIETTPDDPDRAWRWTTGRSTISFENPRADATLHLEVEGRPALFDSPQMLTLTIDDRVLATLEMASDEASHHIVPVPAASLGDAETVTLAVNVDRTFVPSAVTDGTNPDGRELGVRVYYAFLDES